MTRMHSRHRQTDSDARRFFKEQLTYAPKRELGLGALHWPSHEKALRVKWLLKYIDGSRGEWKSVLDIWLARLHEGRGALVVC